MDAFALLILLVTAVVIVLWRFRNSLLLGQRFVAPVLVAIFGKKKGRPLPILTRERMLRDQYPPALARAEWKEIQKRRAAL